MPRHRITFVSSGKSGFSRLATHAVQSVVSPDIEVKSAVLDDEAPSPGILEYCHEFDNRTPLPEPARLGPAMLHESDLIISFDPKIKSLWDGLPGVPHIQHWKIGKPDSDDDQSESNRLKLISADIRNRFEGLIDDATLPHLILCHIRWIKYFENINIGVMVHDKMRRFTYCNPAARRMLGYSRDEIMGKDCHLLFSWRLCGSRCSFCNDKEMHHRNFWYHMNIQRKNGELRNVEMTIIPMFNDAGKNLGAMVCFHDRSGRRIADRTVKDTRQFMGIIGQSEPMQQVFEAIQDAGPTDVSVLIQGESGTGKELVADALHKVSRRTSRPFIAVNCGALPEGLLESELFGHIKGAFTGAVSDKKGRFDLANGGTIFLDEVGELSPMTQVKLLRVLQNGTFERVGGEKTISVDVRVISATNRNLMDLVNKRVFRDDLFYRLSGFPIVLPALRDREEDIPLIARFYLDKLLFSLGKKADCSDEFIELLCRYSWPGNVRELQNVIQFAVIKSRHQVLEPEHLPPYILTASGAVRKARGPGRPKKINRTSVELALSKTGGNKAKAARLLGVSRATLYRFLPE